MSVKLEKHNSDLIAFASPPIMFDIVNRLCFDGEGEWEGKEEKEGGENVVIPYSWDNCSCYIQCGRRCIAQEGKRVCASRACVVFLDTTCQTWEVARRSGKFLLRGEWKCCAAFERPSIY